MSVAPDWRFGPYTVDDLDHPVRFPPDEGTYEMRDGWVLMSPSHDLNHEIIIDNAKAALRSAAARADVEVRVITARASEMLSVDEPFCVQIDVSSLADE